jgi:hypothetical protein
MENKKKITREEHLRWCKDRAFEILDKDGDIGMVYASFVNDMRKHPETENHAALELGFLMMLNKNNTPEEMKKFIEGFN